MPAPAAAGILCAIPRKSVMNQPNPALQTDPPNPLWTLAKFLGSLVNFFNTLVFNLLMLGFLLVAVMIAMAVSAANTQTVPGPLQDKTALVIDLEGTLVEQYSQSPIERAFAKATNNEEVRELQLRDLLTVLDAAKGDDRVQRVVLLTDDFRVAGFAALRELGSAIREVRESGKQVIAYGTAMDQKQYYLAAQAGEVYLDPEGGVVLEGLGRYRLYYREGLQDKLGVDVHLFRVGEFKSAAEPFILDGASPESREADLFWMNDLWRRHLGELATARKLKVEDLDALIQDFPARVKAAEGDLARLALDAKLVDALKTPHEMEEMLIERGAKDDDDSFRQVDFDAYLARQTKPRVLGGDQDDTVAVVVAEGEISGGKQPPGTVGGESTAELLRQVRTDDSIKALVLRVDSPGGSVFPSEQIRREIALIKEAGKPVVVSMGNVAASGGYWISMNADKIYADPSTITGSIGIFGLWMSGPRALEKIGIHSDGVTTAPLAGAFDPSRALDPKAGEIIQSVIDHGYAQFIGKVSQARGKPVEEIDGIARGRVWSGAQAHERGLVDQLGGLRDALGEAARLAKLGGKYDVRYVEREATPWDQLFAGMSANARGAAILRALAPLPTGLTQDAAARIDAELAWLRPERGSVHGLPVRAIAHCFCGL
jgi:protease-4